jgi:hypothetical protein
MPLPAHAPAPCPSPGATARRDPVVLPFYHSGMGEVMPKHAALPRPGKQVTVVVGQPVELADLTCNCNREGVDQREVRPACRKGRGWGCAYGLLCRVVC